MSLSPRFLSSFITDNQNFAPSLSASHMPRGFFIAFKVYRQSQVEVFLDDLFLLSDFDDQARRSRLLG